MSDMVISVSFPLDDEGFLRRECPLCCREFKMKPTPDEMRTIVERSAHALLSDTPDTQEQTDEHDVPPERWCPYCGQRAAYDAWWTDEQLAYLKVVAGNIAARLINEHLIQPLKRSFGGSSREPISIEFKGREIEETEPWMSPEPNDLERFALPCCDRELKIDTEWHQRVLCFFCGFPHPAC